MRIWDPHTGQTRHTLTGHTNTVQALSAAADGSWLASADWDPHTGVGFQKSARAPDRQ